MVCSYWMTGLLFTFLNCRPFSYTWNKMQPGHTGSCVDEQDGTLGFGIVNLVLDFAVILLPLPYLYTLNLKLSKRISLIGIFALGFLITAISAVRIQTVRTAGATGFSYSVGEIALWSFLETSFSLINCCLPTILPALTTIFNNIRRPVNRPKFLETWAHKFMALTTTSNSSRLPSVVGGYAPGQTSAQAQREITRHGEMSQLPNSQDKKKPFVSLEQRSLESLDSKHLPPLPSQRGDNAV